MRSRAGTSPICLLPRLLSFPTSCPAAPFWVLPPATRGSGPFSVQIDAQRKENDHGEKQTDRQAEDRLGLAGDPRLAGLPGVWAEAP